MGEEGLAASADTNPRGEPGEGVIGGDVGEAGCVLLNETGCFNFGFRLIGQL